MEEMPHATVEVGSLFQYLQLNYIIISIANW